jgi:hypothetical protein
VIYEYPNLPQSLYDRVKGIPLELKNLLFDEDPSLEKQSEIILNQLLRKAQEKMNERIQQLTNLERGKQVDIQRIAG